MRPPAPAALVLAAVLGGPLAHADDTGDTALAEALFREGRRLLKAGNTGEACPKFEESYRLVPKLGTLLNLATCHDQAGRTGSAWGEYTKAVTLAKEQGEEARVAYARDKLEDLEARLSKLIVHVEAPVEGLVVTIDGKAIGEAAWDTPLPLDPGSHVIEAKAPGHTTWRGETEMKEGPASATFTIPALEPAPGAATAPATPAPAAPADTPDDEWSSYTVAGLVVGAVGLVGVGVGAYFGVDTFSKQSESEDFCDGTLCDARGVELRDDGQTSAMISNVAFGVGLAGIAAGVTLLIVGALDDDAEEAATGTLLPQLAPGEAGLGWRMTW